MDLDAPIITTVEEEETEQEEDDDLVDLRHGFLSAGISKPSGYQAMPVDELSQKARITFRFPQGAPRSIRPRDSPLTTTSPGDSIPAADPTASTADDAPMPDAKGEVEEGGDVFYDIGPRLQAPCSQPTSNSSNSEPCEADSGRV